MNIFDKAIAVEGSITGLAKALGLTISRVSNWQHRGVPDGWAAVLTARYMPPPAKRQRKLNRQTVVGSTKGSVSHE